MAHVPAYMVDEAGDRFAFITDQVGSVRQVVNVGTGAVVHSMRYTAFGEVLEDDLHGADHPPQPFGYAGGLYDRETGFVRFGARDYDAVAHRWTAKDPIRFEGGDSNLFAYVGNNPVEAVDPTGLQVTSNSSIPWLAFWARVAHEAGPAVTRGVGPLAASAAADAAAAALISCMTWWGKAASWTDDIADTGHAENAKYCMPFYLLCDSRGLPGCHACFLQCSRHGFWDSKSPSGEKCL
jgi:RHS repeat-associated protein